ncbi:helix-turn-helix domain-containing protein [Sphingopyxis indica]|uniref:Transcriptional regulator, IclR family n=1 Tax=Sphingopyxis indica TaxID=436663 RepID=A0A239H9F7_9SPHN|nr:helix-turn-helix domain-containing protein [Sphingopyxis indica]WOF44433.1 helix-turn-helix domain-containing protein [Sphingopyxis indica]SNS77775.1 transcriptional regulator, IclR family [Sphingopyxis indica]
MTGPVRSVSQAFAILRLLGVSGVLSLSEIGRIVGLSPSSCLNLLKTLVNEGAIERDPVSRKYRLATGWQAATFLREDAAARLAERAQPLMARFAQDNEAAVGLWRVVSRERMQLVAHAESDAGMRLSLADDQRQPLGGGAAGRALAAVQGVDASELRRRFAPVRWQAELPFETYESQVRDARARGFAIDDGFAHRGVVTAATGIAERAPGFCLSASIVAGSRSAAEVETLGAGLVELRAALVADR